MSSNGSAPRPEITDEGFLVSVVVPMHNARHLVEDQLAALAGQSYRGGFEVVLVDNRSTDGTSSMLASWRSRYPDLDLRLCPAPEVPGVSHARNTGARCARGALLAICDADDRVSPQWLEVLVSAAATADMVGGGLTDHDATPTQARAWRSRTAWSTTPMHMGFLPYAYGCNTAVWRDVLEAVGGWDETYRRGGDDIDFAWRVQLAGYRLSTAPEARVHYRQRGDLRSLVRQTRAYALQDVRLFQQYADRGAARRSGKDVARGLLWLASRSLPSLCDRGRRGWWLRKAAAQWGRLEGSVRHRVLYL